MIPEGFIGQNAKKGISKKEILLGQGFSATVAKNTPTSGNRNNALGMMSSPTNAFNMTSKSKGN